MPAGFKLGLAAALILLIAVSAYFFAGGEGSHVDDPRGGERVDGGGYYDPGVQVNPSDPALTTGGSRALDKGGSSSQQTGMHSASLHRVEPVRPGMYSLSGDSVGMGGGQPVDQFDMGTGGASQRGMGDMSGGISGDDTQARQGSMRAEKSKPEVKSIDENIDVARAILQRSYEIEKGGRPDFGAQPSATRGSRYTIRKGDSLWKIAEKHYGDGNQYRAILAANPGLSKDRLQLGTQIFLPSVVSRTAPASQREATVARRAALPVNARVVTVRNGDSLYRIADREYGDGTKWRAIYEANRDVLPQPDKLKVGMTLLLPGDMKFEK